MYLVCVHDALTGGYSTYLVHFNPAYVIWYLTEKLTRPDHKQKMARSNILSITRINGEDELAEWFEQYNPNKVITEEEFENVTGHIPD